MLLSKLLHFGLLIFSLTLCYVMLTTSSSAGPRSWFVQHSKRTQHRPFSSCSRTTKTSLMSLLSTTDLSTCLCCTLEVFDADTLFAFATNPPNVKPSAHHKNDKPSNHTTRRTATSWQNGVLALRCDTRGASVVRKNPATTEDRHLSRMSSCRGRAKSRSIPNAIDNDNTQ